jgi:hypothetical protein
LRRRAFERLAPPKRSHVAAIGDRVLVSFTHETPTLKCTRATVAIRKDEEVLRAAVCEACRRPLAVVEEFAVFVEVSASSGVVRYRRLNEHKLPSGPWCYLPIGRLEPGFQTP